MPTFRTRTWATEPDAVSNPGLKGKRFETRNFPDVAPGIVEWFNNITEIAGPNGSRDSVSPADGEGEIFLNSLLKRALLFNDVVQGDESDAAFVNAYWSPGLDTPNGDPINGGYGNLNASPPNLRTNEEDSKGNPLASPWMPNLLPPEEPGDVFSAEADNPTPAVPYSAKANIDFLWPTPVHPVEQTEENRTIRWVPSNIPNVGRSYQRDNRGS